MTTATQTEKKQYLLIICKKNKSLWELRDKFKELKGHYIDVGYIFPIEKEKEVGEIVKELDIKPIKLPLGEQTFDALKLSYKADYFLEQLFKTEEALTEILPEDEETEESINALENSNQKNQALELLYKKKQLEESLDWAKKMEKAVSNISKTLTIKFLSENDPNFLIKDAPEMPRLVNFIDKQGKQRTFIRKGIVAMLASVGGMGKTHWLIQLALSITSGQAFLDKYTIEKPGAVFMGLGENGEDDIHRLINKIFKQLFEKSKEKIELISKRLSVMSFTGMQASFIHKSTPTAMYENILNELRNKEPDEGWSCIILDPISRFLGADAETDNAAATEFIELLERFTIELKGNPTVIFGHHMNKSGLSGSATDQGSARGSSALTDGVRLQINLERVVSKQNDEEKVEKNQITMRMVKSNFTQIIDPQILEKDNGCLKWLNPQW